MEDRLDSRPWLPKPFSVAVLDSDEYLADALCDRLRGIGFRAVAFHGIESLIQAHRSAAFDAYVLDYLADWMPQSTALEHLIASIHGSAGGDTPIFILGNQTAPERVARLGDILMRHKVRYLLRPISVAYLAQQVGEAVARQAGL